MNEREQIAHKLRMLAIEAENLNCNPTLEENRVLKTAAEVLRNNLQHHFGETGENMIFVVKFLETMAGTETQSYEVE